MHFLLNILINKVRIPVIIRYSALVVILLTSFLSCTDDNIMDPYSETDKSESLEDTLTFYLDAGTGFSTRTIDDSNIEKDESTIQSVRVLFFDADTGYFLFDAGRFKNPEKEIDEQENIKYKITINVGNLTDGTHSIANDIRTHLSKNNFKVAFLVNFPDPDRPNWTYENSFLNPSATSYLTINDLHYIREDSNMSQRYDFETNETGYADDYYGWVNNNNISKENAADPYVRSDWNPLEDYKYQKGERDKPFYSHYVNLWKLWNFGEGFENNKITSADLWGFGESVGTYGQWIKRWGYGLNEGTTIFSNDKCLQTDNTEFTGSNGGKWEDLEVVVSSEGKKVKSYNKNNYHGVILPKASQTTSNNKTYLPTDDSQPCLKMDAVTSGHLSIKYSSLGNGTSQKPNIIVQRGQEILEEISSASTSITDSGKIEVKVTGDKEVLYIYNTSATDAVIYAIEFISDIYIYETDRSPVSPSSKGIPMYGVQKYEAFRTWSNGETKDLSNEPVSLIRSVAKVVLYLHDKAPFVYMRCMNRNARCTPTDVETNTYDLWTETHQGSYNSNNQDDCEWFRIQQFTPWYGSELYNQSNSSDKYKSNYKKWLKWYYGSWKSFKGEDWTNANDIIASDLAYPQIFNARIERSDYCEFSYAGIQNGAHKYVLYVPEKGIDDPNDWKDPSSTPKVIHIEYRYEDTVTNLDDNNCYRIYFTNYSDERLGDINTEIKRVAKTGYETYEKNYEHLKKHWPIMRNHVYRFYVSESDGSNNSEVIKVRIDPWGYDPKETWEEVW